MLSSLTSWGFDVSKVSVGQLIERGSDQAPSLEGCWGGSRAALVYSSWHCAYSAGGRAKQLSVGHWRTASDCIPACRHVAVDMRCVRMQLGVRMVREW